jgi:hypothetical protein
MRLIPINTAEAIFEPFFDGSINDLSAWTIDAPGAIGTKHLQGWAFVTVNWTRPAPDGLVLRLHRRFESFACARYDRVVACLNLPEESVITLSAETDAGPRRRTGAPIGATRREEWLPLDGATRILALTVEVRHPSPTPGSGWLMWLALQHTGRLADHLAQWSGYDERWDKYLQPPEFEPTFKPSYGLMVNEPELAAIRAQFAGDNDVTRELRAVADIARHMRPESLIGENMNFWDTNMLRRERDIGKMISIHGSNAAQAGLLWQDKALCRLAARFALSIACCEHWEDIFFAHMPGSAWDQRGFIASIATWDCALILDLCGEWFTPVGRNLILRRLASEAHGSMCQASWWWEYMYYTNQMAWISPSRLYGLLVLEQTMPVSLGVHPRPPSRVAPHTDIAWDNLQENLGHALLADGGYLEGPMYFSWVARQAALGTHLYARARGRAVRDLVSPALLKTHRFAEMLLSTDDQRDMILICDASFTSGEGIAFLAWLMPDSHWVTIYRKQLKRAGSAPLLLALRYASEVPAEGPALSPFLDMPENGLMASVRRLGPEYVKLFLMGNLAGGDHQHEDKGNFILECAGDSFTFDFGVVDYANPVTDLLKQAQRHNLLTPWCETERPAPLNPMPVDIKINGQGDATRFHASMDLEAGWNGWYKKWRRTWDSPTPDVFVITDEWAVNRGEGVIFHWTTPLPMRIEGDHVVIEGRRASARLRIPAGVEAALEQLTLQDPRRTAAESSRRDIAQFGLHPAETQPRLTLRQRGQAEPGVLRL